MYIPDSAPTSKDVAPGTSLAGSGSATGLAMTHGIPETLPLVDSAVLADLEEQLDGTELALRFARDYAAMWSQRCAKLAAAVKVQDMDAALDAVISLKITSAMVGGLRLARLAELLESVIRQGNFDHGQILMKRVAEDGDQTVSELHATYILKNG